MKYTIITDEAKCVGCAACAVACMDEKDFSVCGGDAPFRTAFVEEQGSADAPRFSFRSISCMHCADAPCIAACPMGCLYQDEVTGFTLYDNAACIACRRCLEACPIAHPRFYGVGGKMTKCDGCAERVKAGMKPACVKVCPFGALQLRKEQ